MSRNSAGNLQVIAWSAALGYAENLQREGQAFVRNGKLDVIRWTVNAASPGSPYNEYLKQAAVVARKRRRPSAGFVSNST